VQKLVSRLKDEYLKTVAPDKDELVTTKADNKSKDKPSENGIIVKGIDNCLVRLSRCCNPVPGDSIMGYVTRGRGVSVHRADCSNISDLTEAEGRIIDVRWAYEGISSYNAEITIMAIDRSALLLEITNAIADAKLSVRALNARTTKDNYALIELTVEITDKQQLDKLIKKLNHIENVIEVSRSHTK